MRSVLLSLLAVLLTAPAALAQEQTPQPNPLAPKPGGPTATLAPEPEPEPAPRVEEEIEVIAPRRNAPDFQTVDEFYRAEFEKIRGEFERAPAAPPRAYEAFDLGVGGDSPNDRSSLRDMVRNAPRVRDVLDSGPPKADPTPP